MSRERYRGCLVAVLAAAFLLYGWSVWYTTEYNKQWYASDGQKLSQVSNDGVADRVYAIGTPVGIYLETEGVLVADVTEVDMGDGQMAQPSYLRLRQGDYIQAINGTAISTKEELIEGLQQCNGDPVTLDIRRNHETSRIQLQPVRSGDGTWQLGIWARDNMQGIGILTYITEDGQFGALGHGIHDTDTGEIMEISRGLLYESTILSVEKARQGTPGELMGMIDYRPEFLEGVIDGNETVGIFGHVSPEILEKMEQQGEAVEVLSRDQVECGDAVVRTCVDDQVTDYSIQIVSMENSANGSGMVIEVTDPRLLDETGGIVQGMSGSPILQNGKLAGAVTHVFVNNPTRGYGIFLETMMEHH